VRKILVIFLVFIFGLATLSFADLNDKKTELEKVKKYLVTLDEKIKVARQAKKINKIAELKDFKRANLARAEALKKELEKKGIVVAEIIEVEEVEEIVVRKESSGWMGEAGYGGGALILKGGYLSPLKEDTSLIINAGLGIGSGYTIIIAGVSALRPFGKNFAGIELGLVSYSATVADILGLSGRVSGSRLGLGLFGGTKVRDFNVCLAYNTALGITVSALYKF